jgi:LuxR family transcriptional regulator, maltose regulon positive regulatory protein
VSNAPTTTTVFAIIYPFTRVDHYANNIPYQPISHYNEDMTLLLPTKCYLPPIPAGFVMRPRLVEALNQAPAHRLTLVSAPAGTGKTTLVSAWAQSARKQGMALGWLTLDASDNDPARFLAYLVACLEEGGTVIDQDAVPAGPEEQEPVQAALNRLVLGLVTLERELIIVLDDYHHIQAADVHTALEHLLRHVPPCLHFVLLTRSDPPLALARLRLAGQLLELRMEDLRFSTQEATEFLERFAGITLSEVDAVALNARTEGWIAGLQMAAVSLRGRDDASAFIEAFAGSHRFVFDYLLEQVLDQQEPEVREFLLKTSVLERLCAPLCDAVLGTVGVARRSLDRLERANLFLMPLDEERFWYRYHHLFADLLSLMLEQVYPGLAMELHRRACRWHESHGMIPGALQHALAARDIELAARLVSANVLALVEQADLVPILLRMDALPREQRESLPWLSVAHAWALAYAGQMARADVALTPAEQHLDALPVDERDRISGHIAAVRAYVAWVQGSRQRAVDYAEIAALRLPVEELAVRALNLTTLGNALTQYQASPRAVEVLEQAVALARQAEQPHVTMLAANALAYAHIRLGSLHRAHAVCREAIEIAEAYRRRNGQPLPSAAGVYAELAGVLAEWGETGAAAEAARRGLALSELWGQADTIAICLLSVIEASTLAQEVEEAQQAIRRARRLARSVSPWFVLNVDLLEMRFRLDVNDTGRAARVLHEAAGPLPVSLRARLLVKQNRPDEALSLLQPALLGATQTPSLETVRLGAVEALAFYLRRDHAQALSALERALELAEPRNQMATFVREGEAMESLLRLARVRSRSPAFIGRLFAAFEARRKLGPVPVAEPLIEPLSARELEILGLLNGPLSTPEIAAQLVVSVNTVRTHIKNVYGKLGVHGRSGAVRRAKELALLG